MIQLKGISKTYGQNQTAFKALNNINLTIPKQCIFGIIGKSGAGKSTLLRMLNLLERPSHGTVTLDNVELTALSVSQLRKQRHAIAMIFQHFNLLDSRTAFGNIALPLELLGQSKKQIKQRVLELLNLVGLEDRATHYPLQLSGGQKQRVAIARALATQPTLLLCDEATSALDPEATHSILSLLKKINQQLNLTIVLITHELDVIKNLCDKAAVIHQGEIVETSDTLSLFANPQHPVTQQLILQSVPKTIPHAIRSHAPPNDSRHYFIFSFVGDEVEQAFLTELTRQFNIVINIFQADITTIGSKTFGFTLCSLEGEPSTIKSAVDFSMQQGIRVEELPHD